MFNTERQSLILERLEKNGKVEVSALAKAYATSKETIRRDLREMEAAGILRRTHGGAVQVMPKQSEGYEYPLLVRGMQRYEEKQKICQCATGLIQDGDTIFIDNSSTTVGFLRFVPREMKLTVITNSIQVLLEAGKLNNSNWAVICVGGLLNVKNYSMAGVFSKSFAQNFFPDKAFMSCRGISEAFGMSDASILEIEVKRDMLSRSKQFILMADHTKFGQMGSVYMGRLEEIDFLITDAKADPEKMRFLEKHPMKVLIAR